MATSGSVDFVVTRDEIINDAYSHIGHLDEGEILTAERLSYAARQLNKMIKAWVAQGYHLWTLKEATLFLTAGTASYSLPGARCVSTFDETTTSAAASSGATAITVTSISAIADNDVIGIVVDSDTIHWTTVNGAPSGSTVNFDDALTADVASGSVVYAYATTDLITRPNRILSLRRHDSSNIDTPCWLVSRDEYFSQPNKTSQSLVNQGYYDRQLSAGVLYLWPTPSGVEDVIKFTYEGTIEDFDTAANDTPFPTEWAEALSWSLAVRLGFRENVDAQTMSMVKGMADEALGLALSYDKEDVSVFFQPGFD